MTRLANGFIRVALLLLLASVATACQSSREAAYWGGLAQGVKVTVAVPPSPVDQKIAAASEALAKRCAYAKGGLILANAYVHDAKVQLALDTASLTVNRFCSKPPANVEDATALVAAAAADLIKAMEEAQS